MELLEELSNKNLHFYCSKKGQFLFESVSRSSILLEIVQNWHTKCQGHKKRCPHFSSLRVCPCPATPPVFMKVLLHTEASVQRLFRRSVKFTSVQIWKHLVWNSTAKIRKCLRILFSFGAVHKLRKQDFANFWPPSPLRKQVYYISLCSSISIWQTPLPTRLLT